MRALLRRSGPAVALLLCAVLLLAIGVWRGEAEVVFRKAVSICMECIGLG